MKVGLNPSEVARPLPAFVLPRYAGEQSDDFDLPLHDLFIDHCLDGPRPGQLIIEASRGGGLTACLHWLKNCLARYNQVENRTFEAFDLPALLGPNKRFVLERLKSGEAVLFVDFSVMPFDPQLENHFREVFESDDRFSKQEGPRLQSCRVVIAGVKPFYEWRFTGSFENERLVSLAPWSRDEWIELLGSNEELRARRKTIFPQLDALRPALPALNAPRTGQWLLEAALACPGNSPLSISALFAELLDRMPLNIIDLLRQMDGDFVSEGQVYRALKEEALTVDEFIQYFEVQRIAVKDVLAYHDTLLGTIFSREPGLEDGQRRYSFAISGLGSFLHAGLQLKAIAENSWHWPMRPASFPFIKDLISEGHKEVLRTWLRDSPKSRHKISIAVTLLWFLGEVPEVDSRRTNYLFFEAKLPGITWTSVFLERSQFLSCILDEADFSDSKLDRSLLCGTSFRGANFSRSSLKNTSFTECQLQSSQFIRTSMEGSSFSSCALDNAHFEGVTLHNFSLARCSLERAVFEQCRFHVSVFLNMDLRSTDLRTSRFREVKFEDCRFDFLHLQGWTCEKLSLVYCDLTNTLFTESQLKDSVFQNCRANEVNFQGADLRGAVFRNVNFHAGSSRCGMLNEKPALEGNMTHYYAEHQAEDAWVSPESIRHANFSGADLRGAQFIDTQLFRVDFRGALLDEETKALARQHKAILDKP